MAGHSHLRIKRTWLWPALTGTLVTVFVAAGAAAAIETDTVSSYWRGLWWSISLITTVGFIGAPPRTDAGAALSVVLMVVGFLLLAMVSASLAAFFVREEERPRDDREESVEEAMLASLTNLETRLASIENRLAERPPSPSAPPPGSAGEPGPTSGASGP